ncbi:MAG: hypothetical protein GC152_10975 [Alphaproteobacteria bacterium]|nr:hypothetical protein [Alphaproteobacteria bacterium]
MVGIKVGAAAIGMMAATIGLAAAQDAEISKPRGIVANFDATHLGPVLDELGIAWQERRTDDGGRYIRASVGTAFAFNIVPSACGDSVALTDCVGVSFIALYGGPQMNYQTVSAFNQRYAFTTAGVLPGGRDAFISRYEIADYGIARGNVASSIANFAYLADRFKNEISSGVTTVAQEGFVSDMSENALNRKVAVAMGGEDEALAHAAPAVRHRAAFEAVAEAVRMLNATEQAPKNKIQNAVAKN